MDVAACFASSERATDEEKWDEGLLIQSLHNIVTSAAVPHGFPSPGCLSFLIQVVRSFHQFLLPGPPSSLNRKSCS